MVTTDDEIQEYIEPQDLSENTDVGGGYRFKALILLIIFLIPILIAAYELINHQLSGELFDTIQPHIPQLYRVILF